MNVFHVSCLNMEAGQKRKYSNQSLRTSVTTALPTLDAGFLEPALEAGFAEALEAGLADALDEGLAAVFDVGFAAAFACKYNKRVIQHPNNTISNPIVSYRTDGQLRKSEMAGKRAHFLGSWFSAIC